jgi:homoserine dehydrogenase
MSRAPLRVAVLGAGTVGRQVVRAILDRGDRLAPADGPAFELVGVACRDLGKARAAGLPADLLTDAPAHLVASPETDVVVELMGGDEPAHTLIAAALSAGKPVVTANKYLIAQHGAELEAIARRCNAALRFEAAVAGGIPILGPLAADLAGNEIERVRGIVNGTTNYILTAMAHEGRPYEEILADAQELGYAEADPSGDVEGDDAVNKLVILARLAFGRWLDPGSVVRRPPTALGGAAALGLTIKLLATTTRAGDGIAAAVLPTAVPADSGFGWIDGVMNRLEIDAVPLGTLRLAGPGAGGGATSSAVLGDLIAVARGLSSTWAGLPSATESTVVAEHGLDAPRRWYAFVPPVAVDVLPTALSEAASVAFEDGAAVRSEAVPLAEAKAAFAAILPPGVDVTLYPVDD